MEAGYSRLIFVCFSRRRKDTDLRILGGPDRSKEIVTPEESGAWVCFLSNKDTAEACNPRS